MYATLILFSYFNIISVVNFPVMFCKIEVNDTALIFFFLYVKSILVMFTDFSVRFMSNKVIKFCMHYGFFVLLSIKSFRF